MSGQLLESLAYTGTSENLNNDTRYPTELMADLYGL
jgi:hypothetical protein